MSCYRPLQAMRTLSLDYPIMILSHSDVFTYKDHPGRLLLPCGKCIGCRLAYSKCWAIRNMHEAQVCEADGLASSFVTFTYNDEFNYRNGGALNYRDFQLFMKRLRFALSNNLSDYGFIHNPDYPLRFYMAGEYGTRSFRPHYHVLFYNLGFSDEKLYKVHNGYNLYNSDSISHFWSDPDSHDSMGHVVTGSVTMQSAGYTARYSTKKALQGKSVHLFNHETGEFMPDEFTQMSRKPGIAYEWWKRYRKGSEHQVIMANGIRYKPPRYYDNLLEKEDPLLFEQVKKSRLEFATSSISLANNSIERLEVREKIQLSKMDLLPRYL